jgi:GNAT superfamily N-acetyltransferase
MDMIETDVTNKSLAIRAARADDVPLIHALICELADYEKLRHEVDAREMDVAVALFGPSPRAFCDIAEWQGRPAGFALWFYNYSTFRGRHGIYLEDLFVRPEFRGHGIGKSLIVHLARRCVYEKLPRLQWQVLDWNKPSIEFYESLGVRLMPEWVGCRLDGDALQKLTRAT